MIPEDRWMNVDSVLQSGFATDRVSSLAALSVPNVHSWITDISAVTPGFELTLEKLGADTKKLMDSPDGGLFAGVALYEDKFFSAIEKLGADTLALMDKPPMGLDSLLDSGLDMGNLFKNDVAFENSLAALGATIASSLDSIFVQDLIDKADVFRAEIEALDIDERADELFGAHTALADSIEHLPMLVSLSQENRDLVIWFVRIAVTLYVTCLILNVSMENADLAAIVGAVGLSGPAAGVAAGKGAKYLLEKLPAKEEQQQGEGS